MVKHYHPNGMLEYIKTYDHGVFQGPIRVYAENGNLLRDGQVDSGILRSPAWYHDSTGKTIARVYITNMEIDSTLACKNDCPE